MNQTRSEQIMQAFYRDVLGKEPCWANDKIGVAAAIEAVADRLCTDLGELECPIEKLREIASVLRTMPSLNTKSNDSLPLDVQQELDRLENSPIMNYETEIINGNEAIVRHIFPREELSPGTRWISASGNVVTIDEIRIRPPLSGETKPWYEIYYSWFQNGEKRTHHKDHFCFQCRYCLIVK